jgi:indoleamine 2,3-dioxygenase
MAQKRQARVDDPEVGAASPNQPAEAADRGLQASIVERGFLPAPDPLRSLPTAFARWDAVAADLPKLLAATKLGPTIDGLPTLDARALADASLPRAMLVLSFLAHGYVWEEWGSAPRQRLPASLAIPWTDLARRIGRPPVLSYASYALDNWRRLDSREPIALGNVALLQNFLGGQDEEWFVAVHVEIEAKAASLLASIAPAQDAARRKDERALAGLLEGMAATLASMLASLQRMPEKCDPYIYYNRVRPFIHGFSQHPIVYEGVVEFGEQPRAFHGETGAQSTIIPAVDAALGIGHSTDELRVYLSAMRQYMPPAHRAFLTDVEQGPSIRAFVLEDRDNGPLREAYDAAVRVVGQFRAKHLEYAATYIHQQSQRGANSTAYGTGGTPFMPYLKKHRDETNRHLLGS